MSKSVPQPTRAQKASFRRKTSFGVLFERSNAITSVRSSTGEWVPARSSGRNVVLSVRRFGSQVEASIHGRRFKRIEGHASFYVVLLLAKPNAWVNLKTKKTNPLIGRKRTNRR